MYVVNILYMCTVNLLYIIVDVERKIKTYIVHLEKETLD